MSMSVATVRISILSCPEFEYYGQTGELLKTAYYDDYRDGALGVRSMRIDVESTIRPGEKTTLRFSNLRKLDLASLAFTPEGMLAFRRAARDKQAADGRQARPEDIVSMLGLRAP